MSDSLKKLEQEYRAKRAKILAEQKAKLAKENEIVGAIIRKDDPELFERFLAKDEQRKAASKLARQEKAKRKTESEKQSEEKPVTSDTSRETSRPIAPQSSSGQPFEQQQRLPGTHQRV